MLPTLSCGDVWLRPFRADDEISLASNISNPHIAAMTYQIAYPYTRKDAQDWLRSIFVPHEKSRSLCFAVDHGGAVVGGIGFQDIQPGHKAEIGYWLAERYWGRGIMTEAVRIVTDFGACELGLRRVYANVYTFNDRSMRVLEKAGYSREGLLRYDILKDGNWVDTYLYAAIYE